jgi:hypothetical protein
MTSSTKAPQNWKLLGGNDRGYINQHLYLNRMSPESLLSQQIHFQYWQWWPPKKKAPQNWKLLGGYNRGHIRKLFCLSRMSPEFFLSSQNHFQCCEWWLSDDQLNQSSTELKAARWEWKRMDRQAFLLKWNVSRIPIELTESLSLLAVMTSSTKAPQNWKLLGGKDRGHIT